MLREPRAGDRDVRNEDRYLFLEALMAARGHLHLSYVGEDVNAGSVRNPAAPLAELLHWLDDETQAAERPWRVAHPLQPFDARYFSTDAARDPRLFSFATAFAQVPEKPELKSPPFLGAAPSAAEPAAVDGVALAALRRFWRNPLRAALRDRAGVSLEALEDDSWPDREPFEPRLGRRELIESRLMYEALRHGGDVPPVPPRWLADSGLLAAGTAGERAYDEARTCAQSALDAARAVLGPKPRLGACRVECELDDGLRLSGTMDRVYHADARAPCLFEARPWAAADFRSLLPFYLDYAALRLGALPAADAHFVEKATKSSASGTPPLLAAIRAQDDAQLRAGLTRLAELARGAEPLVFPPATAWAWLNAAPAERAREARRAWEGERLPGNRGTRGERHHSPPYGELMLRDAGLLAPGSAAHARFVAATEAVADVLDPTRTLFVREGRHA
jgi:exodeoxyribonuclease V gamma subunit